MQVAGQTPTLPGRTPMGHDEQSPRPPRPRKSLLQRLDRFSRRLFNGPPYQAEGQPFHRGRLIGLTLPRRFVCDLLHFARKIPSIPIERRMHLADVVAVRKSWTHRVSWCAIFMKAFAIVAARRPEFRRVFMHVPWGYLYEHPANVANVSVEREFDGEPAVFFGQIVQPELLSLASIDHELRRYRELPIEKIDVFQRSLRLSRLPLPFRRLVWWAGLNLSGLYRAWFFGTFGISVTASFGAASLHQLSPLSTMINYSTFEPDGTIEVRLTYDHRVIDGATVARALVAIEEALHVEILAELLAEAE